LPRGATNREPGRARRWLTLNTTGDAGVKSKDDVMKMGIATYNEECRSIVMRYSKEWEIIVGRMGRWIDFDNDYKTLDPSYMESVWWVFKQLFEQDLVYRGFKVRRVSATPAGRRAGHLVSASLGIEQCLVP
jgi:isoleucyl-tRNA synthetase